MNEKKKMILILIVLTVFLASLGIAYLMSYKEAKAEAYKFYNAYNSKDKQIVLIGKETCYYCTLLKPIIDDFNYQYDFGYTYIDTNKISGEQLEDILNTLGVDKETFGTPYTAIVQDQKKIDEFSGAGTEQEYLEFLAKNEFVKEKEKNPISYINYEEYQKLLNEKNAGTIIVIGESNNQGYATAMKYLRNINAEYNKKIYYINTQEFEKIGSVEYQSDNKPVMIVIKGDGQQEVLTGNKTYEEYISFLQKNDII